MEKIVTVIMGQNCEKFIGMCLESIKDSDAIVYCDGGSSDGTVMKVGETTPNVEYITNEYDQEDKAMNGKQRNFYLDYVKKNYPDYWCLCLDADEVVDDFNEIRAFINRAPPSVCSVKMRHFIGDLGHEDSTVPIHYVLNRLFKISRAELYPEVEHPVLIAKDDTQHMNTDCTTIWHLAYVPNMWDIKKRYDGHMKKSNIHTPQYLKGWYYSHLFGQYPRTGVRLIDIPSIILKEFGIDKDEFYFANRGLELKHAPMVIQWNRYFEPDSVLDLGCGVGPYIYYWNMFGKETKGIDLSKYAIQGALTKNIVQGDIRDLNAEGFDLVTAIDVLEHIDYGHINKTIKGICKAGKNVLLSVPVIGDPNLENDKTHKIKETKEWWIKQFVDCGMEHLPTPTDWMFKEQLFIFRWKE